MRKTSIAILSISVLLAVNCASVAPPRMPSGIPTTVSAPYIEPSQGLQPAQTTVNPAPYVSGQPLSLAECITAAWQQNPQSRSSWLAMQSAEANAGRARSELFPSVEATAGASRGEQFSQTSLKTMGLTSLFSTSLGISYTVFDGGARSASIQNAEAGLIDAGFQHNTVLQDVALNVTEAFYELLAANQLVSVAEQGVEQTRNHVQAARARYESGIVNRSDVLRAETDRADADLSMVRALNGVRIARARLANAMGMSVTDSLSIRDLPENMQDQIIADVGQLIKEALARRPEIHSSLARIEERQADLKYARSRYWPSLTTDIGFGMIDRQYNLQQRDWAISIGLRLPVFDGFDRDNLVRLRNAELQQALAEHEQLRQGIELEVWNTYSQMVEAEQVIEAVKVLVASADEALRVAEGEYQNGVGSIILLIDAQTAQNQAHVRLVQSRLDWQIALARIERVIGRTLLKEAANSFQEVQR